MPRIVEKWEKGAQAKADRSWRLTGESRRRGPFPLHAPEDAAAPPALADAVGFAVHAGQVNHLDGAGVADHEAVKAAAEFPRPFDVQVDGKDPGLILGFAEAPEDAGVDDLLGWARVEVAPDTQAFRAATRVGLDLSSFIRSALVERLQRDGFALLAPEGKLKRGRPNKKTG